MILSIFSCACWLFTHLLFWNIYSVLLLNLLISLFVFLRVSYVFSICTISEHSSENILSQSILCVLMITISFDKQNVLVLYEVQFISFVVSMFHVLFKKSLLLGQEDILQCSLLKPDGLGFYVYNTSQIIFWICWEVDLYLFSIYLLSCYSTICLKDFPLPAEFTWYLC